MLNFILQKKLKKKLKKKIIDILKNETNKTNIEKFKNNLHKRYPKLNIEKIYSQVLQDNNIIKRYILGLCEYFAVELF